MMKKKSKFDTLENKVKNVKKIVDDVTIDCYEEI